MQIDKIVPFTVHSLFTAHVPTKVNALFFSSDTTNNCTRHSFYPLIVYVTGRVDCQTWLTIPNYLGRLCLKLTGKVDLKN